MGDKFWILSQEEAKRLFLETDGAWLNMRTVYENTPRRLNKNDTQARRNRYRETAHMWSTLGYHSFIVPYERYKKYCKHYSKNPSLAFGFEKYSDSNGDQLTRDYRKTIVNTWVPDQTPPKGTWLADMIRNSFAHAQATLTGEGENTNIAITNTRDGTSLNFDIVMDLQDFQSLIITALNNFKRNVVPGGRY